MCVVLKVDLRCGVIGDEGRSDAQKMVTRDPIANPAPSAYALLA